MRDTKYRLDHVYTTYYTCLVMHILTGQHFITSNFLIIIDCPEKKKEKILLVQTSYRRT